MTADSASINLTHHFLIAMPGLEDATFAKSVVYLCEHSERGALGLVINKPSDLSMRGLFEKVELPLHRADLVDAPVLKGGPVHTERGFVLHEGMFAHPQEGAFPAQYGAEPVQGNLDLGLAATPTHDASSALKRALNINRSASYAALSCLSAKKLDGEGGTLPITTFQ